ncbi:MAG: DUF1648 domain-containing protein [Candidatus Micrarchaeota archaeon]|nr:DUF1648 domain-containing protein [Candidatus Micrarchaeota archaeon]
MGNIFTSISAVILSSLFISFLYYPILPSIMATHWDAGGNPNGYMPKEIGAFLIPVLLSFLFLLLAFLPRFDRKLQDSKETQKYYYEFVIVIFLFLVYVHSLSLAWNALPFSFDLSQFMVLGFAALLYFMGYAIGHAKQNFTMGIRIPPTLSDEKIWEKTHRLGSSLFKASAIISLAGMLLPEYSFIILICSAMLSIVICVAYAYIEYYRTAKK